MSTFNGGPQSIVTNGLVLYLDAANHQSYTSGSTTWRDLSVERNNGTLTNGPTFSNANGGSIVFDGADDYILGPVHTNIQGNTNTWEVWVNRTFSSNSFNMIMGSQLPYFSMRNDNYFVFSHNVGRTQRVIVGISQTIQNNRWYNASVTMEYDGNNTTFKLYVNGTQQTLSNTGTFSGQPIPDLFNRIVIGDGRSTTTPWYPFNGTISSVKIYNRALSAAEILQNYNATRQRYGV